MILSSDLILTHPLWERADMELKDNMGIFKRLIDIYLIACAIGIKDDKVITEIKEPLISPKSIARNTYMSPVNINLRESLDFMLQNALINSATLDLSMDERLKLAFDPDYSTAKLNASTFLTGFANYGIEEIFKRVDSESPLVVLDELYKYFNELTESKYDEILKNITLDTIK